jgi:hypothetical protein
MTNITPDTLDKLDRFRAAAIVDIKGLELPDELAVSLRQGFSRFLNKAVEDAIQPATPGTPSAPTNPNQLEY